MKTSTAACVAILLAVAHAASKLKSTRYEATWESLDKRPIPQWFEEAKFGIFLHWGLFSVPGIYAWLWYLWKGPNPQMDVVQYMEANYPPDWTYADFGPQFKTEFFDPYQWADIFNASGARYNITYLDPNLYSAGTIFGHFCNGAGRAQCKYIKKLLKRNSLQFHFTVPILGI